MYTKGNLILHKTEWDKLSRKQKSNDRTSKQKEFITLLNEISRNWMKSWKDTEQGQVYLAAKQKDIERAKNVAFIEQYLSRTKENNSHDVLKNARKQIFEDTCYGRCLISALLESKTLEERDVQIEFQKKLKDEANFVEQKKPQWSSIETAPDMEKKENQIKHLRQEKNKEVAEINKALSKSKRDREVKEKQKERIWAREYQHVIKRLELKEAREKIQTKKLAKEELKKFINEQKIAKNTKTKRDIEKDNKIAEVRNQQDRLKCKIDNIHRKVIKEQGNNNNTMKVYRRLQNIKEMEKKRFDDFIESGIKRKEMEAKVNTHQPTMNLSTADNRKSPKTNKINVHQDYSNKCVCERQCLITKSLKERNCSKIKKALDLCTSHIPNFSKPKKLIEIYKERQRQDSPWSGLHASHKQFAEQATNIMRECRYKNAVQRVVRDYRRLNILDERTLPLKNC